MRLSDVIGSLGLTFFPIAGMILFIGVFAGVLVRIGGRARRAELERAALLPLGDDATARTEARP